MGKRVGPDHLPFSHGIWGAMPGSLLVAVLLSGASGTAFAEDVQPDLVQTRFVTKDHITSPTGISASPQGVVFVSCDVNGITNRKKQAGKVVRCEDTDGDGIADRFSNFVEGIDSPRGSCYVDNTLYLMQPPFLVAYQDPNGDGVAEKKTVLVTQLGQPLEAKAVKHGQNGIRMGIDGWLYLAIGDQGCFEATGTDGSQATLHGGGILRVRPDGSQISVLLTGTRNIYDVAVDPYLDLFARDNTNDGGGWNTRFHHLTELADFGYPHLYKNFSHEHRQALADYGAGAGTGMYYLQEPGFPEDFGEALYSGDFNTGVSIHRRRPSGESYQIKQEPFMNLPKNVDMDVDGFSRMYCASWQGGGFGLATTPFGHVDLIQPKDRKGAAVYPEIDKASDDQLLTHLASQSQVTRINTMREMVTRGGNPTFSKGLVSMASDNEAPLYVRVAAVMTLKQLGGTRSHAILRRLYQDTDLREFVVRALGDVATEIDAPGKKVFLKALQDDNPRVRMRAIVALARAGDVTTASAILPLARDQRMIADDDETGAGKEDPEGWSAPIPALPHTALKAVIKLNAMDLLLRKLDDTELRDAALRGLQEIHSGKVVTGLASKLETTDDKQLAKRILLALFRLYHREAPWDGKSWWQNRPNFKGPYVEAMTWSQTPAVKAAIEAGFRKVDPADYAYLFKVLRRNQVPESALNLDITFDEVLSFLEKENLTDAEHTRVMNAATDKKRPEKEMLRIYTYFKGGSLPDSYFNRAQILRKWGEGQAEGQGQRQAYSEFVSGGEFIGRLGDLRPFFKESREESYKYAHLQLLHLMTNPDVPEETRNAAAAELEITWADQKNIYPHRLRGLMLAFEEWDFTPYAERLKPLVNHRDERVKQPAARFLKAIEEGRAGRQ